MKKKSHSVFLSLGSNLGDRMLHINTANQLLIERTGDIVSQSYIYETKAWGLNGQPDFLNLVLELQTTMTPKELMNEILEIEKYLGRKREKKWDARTIDIDILFYENEIIDLPELTIPHPELEKRRFVLVPFNEIAPNYVHPKLNKTIAELLESSIDKLEVRLFGLKK